MRQAKSGQWWLEHPELSLANNSVCYTEKPDPGVFMREWLSLYESKSGERGIFNRNAAKETIKNINKRAGEERRKEDYEYGVNPCGEILLKSKEFCNLSEVVLRKEDDFEAIRKKIDIATIIGTWQASLTDFKYVSKQWSENCKEEALLGVSMTGIMDNPLTNGSQGKKKLIALLQDMRENATNINKYYAQLLGINQAAAVTCVKPSGNTSQLVDSSSGIHARHSKFYSRGVRVSIEDPIAKFMIERGFPHEADHTKPNHTVIFYFPVKSPDKCITRTDKTAIEQMELWMIYKDHYCDHNPSTTINVKEHEWPGVGAWVWDNFDKISGIAFLPFSEHSYKQAPYEECTEAEYLQAVNDMPEDVDWTELAKVENEDNTTGTHELACSSGSCEF